MIKCLNTEDKSVNTVNKMCRYWRWNVQTLIIKHVRTGDVFGLLVWSPGVYAVLGEISLAFIVDKECGGQGPWVNLPSAGGVRKTQLK